MKKKLLQLSATVVLQIVALSSNAQTSWLITGNSNTTGSSFIGTRNAQPLVFRTNNIVRMRLTQNGQLGIGIGNPTYSLQIQNPSFARGISVTNNFVGTENRIGLYSSSVNNPGYGYGIQAYGGWFGVYGIGQGGNYSEGVIGVLGEAQGSGAAAGSRYGIYGNAAGGSFNAAGFFNGDVWAVSYNLVSDRKVKTDIAPLSNSLEQLMKLKPASFHFKTAEYPKWGLSNGKQIGFIADEVKQVFPELVKEAVHPAEYDKDKIVKLRQKEKYEGINYLGFIPILIASVQEQQKIIQQQQKTIAGLESEKETIKAENQEFKSRFNKIEQTLALNYKQISAPVTLSSARLEQNTPNPFNQNTVINYYLPDNIQSANITITDANGRIIKTVPLTAKGNGQFIIHSDQLAAGTYQYSLIVNEKAVDTKKMLLLR